MTLEFTNKQFRRLLDLVYIGNWILNSTRGDQRFADYDEVESLVFGKALVSGMPALAEVYEGEIVPSRAFAEGGIHEAIEQYEDTIFYELLAEEKRSLPFNPASSIKKMTLTTSPPSCSTNLIAASMVPPVAIKSSTKTTFCPGLMESLCISMVACPYSKS